MNTHRAEGGEKKKCRGVGELTELIAPGDEPGAGSGLPSTT